MDANLKHRPKADELRKIFSYWNDLMSDYDHSGREIKAIFEEADKEIPNISTSYEKDPDAIYTSRPFTFSNLPIPVNSFIIQEEKNEVGHQDSQLLDLDVKRFW
ncbi:unnamed protein product [Rhizophagus irregularis]|nr:unnamed protein product [Rhizophagus irregularis]